ncbi:hypothetical protein B0I35DRAFT_406374 [Stachybotrys elegans]|uniref:Uncharacterized protein n=1 Tax=Stachybotrys elegans TaxID=80388 RepID=A0A8K0WTT8_9HYPO|nr:hypothetical protein B0I35DRAFT_406374 [Stachybotrys elegans]
MGSSASKTEIAPLPHGVNLPIAFNLYYQKSWGLKFRLGEHESNTLYSAALSGGWQGDLVLYNGPNTDETAALATVRSTGTLGGDNLITLPPPVAGARPVQEEMRRSGVLHEVHTFAMPVGSAAMPQKFEWHRASKEELAPLGVSSHGWKLVYNGETVALWADAKMLSSMTKAARFMFVNSGATGQLGIMWALMAVVTFVRLYQKQVANNTIVASTSAASAGAAAAVSG